MSLFHLTLLDVALSRLTLLDLTLLDVALSHLTLLDMSLSHLTLLDVALSPLAVPVYHSRALLDVAVGSGLDFLDVLYLVCLLQSSIGFVFVVMYFLLMFE